MNLLDFDKVLCHFNRREEGELWKVGDSGKLAFLIVYLSENKPISPPFIKPNNHSEIYFVGGNHRYAIAKALGEDEIPIYVVHSDKDAISKLLPVRWANVYKSMGSPNG